MCKLEYLITTVGRWIGKARRIAATSIFLLAGIYIVFLLCNKQISKSLFLPTDIRTEINGDYYLEKKLNKKEEIETIETTEDRTTISRNFELIFILGTLIIAYAGLHIANTTLNHKQRENQTKLLTDLLRDWESNRMKKARASLCLRYLLFIKNKELTLCTKEIKKVSAIFIKKKITNNISQDYKQFLKYVLDRKNIVKENDLTYLTQEEESVLKIFEHIGLFLKNEDLNKDYVWECFISKIEPYFRQIGAFFIINKRENFTNGYFFHYDECIIKLICTPNFYKEKIEQYDGSKTKCDTFKSFQDLSENEQIERSINIALSETRYIYKNPKRLKKLLSRNLPPAAPSETP